MRASSIRQFHSATAPETTEPESATVKSAKRVLEILELFKEKRSPLATTEIAVELGFPVSSTAALLKSLTSLGYLHFDRTTRTYNASLRVGLLGGWSQNSCFAPGKLSEVSRDLAQETRQTVIVGLRNENHIQYVSVIASHANVRYYLPVGSRQRLVDTPMGRALLSLDGDSAIDRLVRRANAERAENQPRIDTVALRDEIAEIRRNGYSYTNGGHFQGACAIAVPLPTVGTEPPLVLGLGGPAEEIEADRQHFISLVRNAARLMSDGQGDNQVGRNTAQPLFA